MSNSLPSDEVAADFRDALQDLRINSRPEISNLTVIAKENTEHAQAISRELEEHIRKTRPEWKLPALYVLDSIVKNVGTPYTVYLGRGLYHTFMGAYTLVDQNTRKSMESLMKTWKQPVPESLDPRPVFPPEVTRDIESALIKMRTVLLQHQQQGRPQQQPLPPRPIQQSAQGHQQQQQNWRNTPTPPQAGWHPPPNGAPQFQPSVAQPPVVPSPLRQYATSSYANGNVPYAQPAPQQAPYRPPPDLGQVKRDVEQLIVSVSIELATNASDGNKSLLENLVNLQKILQSPQGVPSDALATIDQEVTRIRGSFKPVVAPPPKPTPPPVQFQPPTPQPAQLAQLAALLQSTTQQNGTPVQPPFPPPATNFTPQPPPPPIQPASNDQVTALLQALAPKPGPYMTNTPPPPQLIPGFQPPPSAPPVAPVGAPPPAPSGGIDLFASLRAAGLLSNAAPSVPITPDSRVKSPVPSAIPSALAALTGPRLRLETSSLKQPRPHMLTKLYADKPDQCRQCGRRFPATDEGKKRKAEHLDWHFKTATKMADAANNTSRTNIVNRLPYIGELDWIHYREPDPLNPDAAKITNTSPSKARAMRDVVPVPKDGSEMKAVCPICQEKFDKVWSDDMQTWVWTDTIRVVGKPWHKSCFDEVKGAASGGGGSLPVALGGAVKSGTPSRSTPTPDSVLGKRKYAGEA